MEKGPVFGLSIGELLTIYDRDSQSWKMSECLFTGDYARYSEALPKSGMMRNGKIYAQATWVPRTEGSESGLWRTSRARDAGSWFPTPQVFDATCGDLKGKQYNGETRHAMKLIQAVKRFHTPRANDAEKRGQIANDPRNGLPAAVKYPTPRANKPEGYSSEGFRPTLAQVVTGEDKPLHGSLNPQFVEWLMGYPLNYTDMRDDLQLSLISG